MVTALNHVVADGRRAGGLNLSSSILTDNREGARQAEVPPPFQKRQISFLERAHFEEKLCRCFFTDSYVQNRR